MSVIAIQQQQGNLEYWKADRNQTKQSNKISLFNIHDIDYACKDCVSTVTSSVRLNCFELIWILKGKGNLIVDGYANAFSGNVVFFLVPGQTRLLVETDDIQGYQISVSAEFISFSESHLSSLVSNNDRNKGLSIYPDEKSTAEMLIVARRMKKEFENFYLLRSEILKGFLKVFLIYLSRKIEIADQEKDSGDKRRDQEIVENFMLLLRKHYASKKRVEEYASELCVTPNYLNWVIKKISGFPASHHIQQHIILEAKKRALYSMLRMKQIANELGFNDYAHFSKYFKNYSGTSFSHFRKKILQ
jgi:AraC family transcriptional regulator, transcriptional activator of pobA